MIEVRGVSKTFAGRGPATRALRDVSMTIGAGETVGCIGESGSGKSTLARIIAGLEQPTSGSVLVDGRERGGRGSGMAPGAVGMVFQDPYGSLPPHMTIGDALAEPLRIAGIGDATEHRRRAHEQLELVGLPGDAAERLPHEFSGGQRQRICIARALMRECRLLIADEPVAALDVSIQAQVINLLTSLQARLGFAMLFISHDLRVIRYMADRMLVMYHGTVMEEGPAEQVVAAPASPYTEVLLSALPGDGRSRTAGALPQDADVEQMGEGDGCPFSRACPRRAALPAADAAVCERPGLPVTTDATGARRTSCQWSELR